MIRRPKTINFWYGKLPHWEVEEGRYFITLHVAGAIPSSAKNQIRAKIDEQRLVPAAEKPDWIRLQRLIFGMMEKWLDRVTKNAWLKNVAMAEMLDEAIQTRQDRRRWAVHSSVIMPNHIHMFAEIPGGYLKSTMEDFKRWTGHQAMKLMKEPVRRFWQKEWFDHWSRSDEQDDRILKYIRDNPIKAGLGAEYLQLPYVRPPS